MNPPIVLFMITNFAIVWVSRWYYVRLAARDIHRRRTAPLLEFELIARNRPDVVFEDEFVTLNGHSFYRQSWAPRESPKAIMIYLHGINNHSASISRDIHLFTSRGIKVFGFDQRGHGRSNGVHGYIGQSAFQLAEDVASHIEEIIQREGCKQIPLFVMGASMGGLIALLYARRYGTVHRSIQLKGCLFMCPLIEVHRESTPAPIVIRIGQLFRSLFPELPIASANRRKGFTDEKMMEEILKQPLVYKGNIRVGTGLALRDAFQEIGDHLHEISTPFLVQHGTRDSVVNIRGTYKLMKQHTSSDATLITYDAEHALLVEPVDIRNAVICDAIDWMLKRC